MEEKMRFSKSYIKTLKETPKEAEIASHKLLLRAGMIKKLTSGVYTYLPLGLKALKKVEKAKRLTNEYNGLKGEYMKYIHEKDVEPEPENVEDKEDVVEEEEKEEKEEE